MNKRCANLPVADQRASSTPFHFTAAAAVVKKKLVAKPDEADEVRTFLADAVRLASQEQGTIAVVRAAHRHDNLLDRRCVSVRR